MWMYSSLKILSFLQTVVYIVGIDCLSNNTLVKRTVTFNVRSLLHFFQTSINILLSCHVYGAVNSKATFSCRAIAPWWCSGWTSTSWAKRRTCTPNVFASTVCRWTSATPRNWPSSSPRPTNLSSARWERWFVTRRQDLSVRWACHAHRTVSGFWHFFFF